MARIARVVVPGLPHHITQRGNRRMKTFFSEADYRMYLASMDEWCLKHQVEIWAYCLMPNHIHLIATPTTAEGDDKNSLFRVKRREFPSCFPPQYVSQDVAGPQIESRPARSRPLFKCVWPISSIMSTADLVPILLKYMHFGNRKPVGRMRCI